MFKKKLVGASEKSRNSFKPKPGSERKGELGMYFGSGTHFEFSLGGKAELLSHFFCVESFLLYV